MNDLEQRLQSTLAEYRRQVTAPADLIDRPAVRPRPHRAASAALLAAAAVVLVVALVVSTLSDGAGRGDVATGPAAATTAADFDRAASALCVRLVRGTVGVAPRFATVEAHTIVADQLEAAIGGAAAEWQSLPPPADEARRRIAGRTAAILRAARAAAARAAAQAEAADLDGAAAALSVTDARLRRLAHVLAPSTDACSPLAR